MMLHTLFSRRDSKVPAKRPEGLFFRPRLEGYEDRIVPSASVGVAAMAAPVSVAASDVISFKVSRLHLQQDGSLLATGHLGENNSFSTVVTISTSPPAVTGGIPSVQMNVGAIQVDLRGISVDTSAIGLSVTPTPGATGSFGSVLAGVATQLNAGASLQTVLGSLSMTDLATLNAGVKTIINTALANVTAQSSVASASGQPGKFGELDFSFGPASLTVVGQTVAVDNGAGGPATATITAGGGRGHLLDNLFNKLDQALQSGDQHAIHKLMAQIIQRINLIED